MYKDRSGFHQSPHEETANVQTFLHDLHSSEAINLYNMLTAKLRILASTDAPTE
jgi:hypothetical protein